MKWIYTARGDGWAARWRLIAADYEQASSLIQTFDLNADHKEEGGPLVTGYRLPDLMFRDVPVVELHDEGPGEWDLMVREAREQRLG